jgi:mannose-1-phosphate guanylyltransferase
MKGMILAAGLGTRLRPLTNAVPKPMVDIAGKPCLEHMVHLLARHGITEIIINLHHMPGSIRNHFRDGSDFGVRISYSYESELMGTAGGLKRVENFFGNDDVLVVSGDALTDIDLHSFFKLHKASKSLATLALKRVADPTQYGVVICEEHQIIQFQEKPKKEEAISSLANTGIYLFTPGIFRHIPRDSFYDFGRQVFPELLEKGEKICGYIMNEYWCDMGDLSVYREAHYDILTGVVRVDLSGKRLDSNIWIGSKVSIHPDTVLVGPIWVGDNCTIEKGARIYGPAILGSNTIIGKNSILKRNIFWNGVTVGCDAVLSDTVVTCHCTVPTGVMLRNEVVQREIEEPTSEVAYA